MANNTTGNPWTFDTATAVTIVASGIRGHIYNIFWASATAADTCQVQMADGSSLWSSLGTQAPLVAGAVDGIFFNGIKVPTLTAGTLYIYWDN